MAQSGTSSGSTQGTISSLRGDYLYTVVQMTKDLHPVVYASQLLPETAFDLRVADVTLEQFEALSLRQQRKPTFKTLRDWQTGIGSCMISLTDLLKVCIPSCCPVHFIDTFTTDLTHAIRA